MAAEQVASWTEQLDTKRGNQPCFPTTTSQNNTIEKNVYCATLTICSDRSVSPFAFVRLNERFACLVVFLFIFVVAHVFVFLLLVNFSHTPPLQHNIPSTKLTPCRLAGGSGLAGLPACSRLCLRCQPSVSHPPNCSIETKDPFSIFLGRRSRERVLTFSPFWTGRD